MRLAAAERSRLQPSTGATLARSGPAPTRSGDATYWRVEVPERKIDRGIGDPHAMQWIQFDAEIARLVEAAQREYAEELKGAGLSQPIEGWVERNAPRGMREWNVTAGFVQFLAEHAVPFSLL
jgi:hypothetical protein